MPRLTIFEKYYTKDGFCFENSVQESVRRHTGVRWITLNNWIDELPTLEEAIKKYPKAMVVYDES